MKYYLIFFSIITFTQAQQVTINGLYSIGSEQSEYNLGIAIDHSGNSYIIGRSTSVPDFNFTTPNFYPDNNFAPGCFFVKCDKNNNPLWGYNTKNAQNNMYLTNAAITNNNDIVLTGIYRGIYLDVDFSTQGKAYLENSNLKNSLFFVVYDSMGNYKCHNQILALHDSLNQLTGDLSFISDVKTDNENNIYVTGYCGDVMLPEINSTDTIREFSFFIMVSSLRCYVKI